MQSEGHLGELVDLLRYPIHDLSSKEGKSLLSNSRHHIRTNGVCAFPGFLTQQAIAEITKDALRIAPTAHHSDNEHNIYLQDEYFTSVDNEAEHRIRTEHVQHSAKTCITYDQIPRESALAKIYNLPVLTNFLAHVLEKEVLFQTAGSSISSFFCLAMQQTFA